MAKELTLPARLDFASLGSLYEELKEARGEDIVLDASKVTHLGSCGLQLLASAQKSWDGDGHSLDR
ncbi:MAG: STAS domain-containing protein, partial [Pseudomonadota bacterium]